MLHRTPASRIESLSTENLTCDALYKIVQRGVLQCRIPDHNYNIKYPKVITLAL